MGASLLYIPSSVLTSMLGEFAAVNIKTKRSNVLSTSTKWTWPLKDWVLVSFIFNNSTFLRVTDELDEPPLSMTSTTWATLALVVSRTCPPVWAAMAWYRAWLWALLLVRWRPDSIKFNNWSDCWASRFLRRLHSPDKIKLILTFFSLARDMISLSLCSSFTSASEK